MVMDCKNNPDKITDSIRDLEKEIDNMKVALKESNFENLYKLIITFTIL